MNQFDRLAQRKRPILACLIQPGDADLPDRQAEICIENGADVLEVSLPYAFPHLDGAVVRQSMQRALDCGMTQPRMELELCRLRRGLPEAAIVLMGYRNLRLSRVRTVGDRYNNVDGILQLGNPAFHRLGSSIMSMQHAIHRIGFVSNRLTAKEIANAKCAGGYVMLQAAAGKTGMRRSFDKANARRIVQLREEGVMIPILLGFGISTPAHARQAMQCGANGVIVGSACTIRARAGERELARFVIKLRAAIDEAG